MWGKLSLREKSLLLLLICGLAIAVTYHLIWQVQYTRYVSLQKTLRAETAKLAQARDTAKNLSHLEAIRLQTDARLTEIKSKFAGDLRWGLPIVEVGQHLEGLLLEAIYPSEITPKDHYYEAAVNIKVKGMYPQVISFINTVDSLPQVSIKAVHLASEKPAEKGLAQFIGFPVSAELRLLFYGLWEGPIPPTGNEWAFGRFDLFAPVSTDPANNPAPAVKPTERPGENRVGRDQSPKPFNQKEEQFPIRSESNDGNIYSFPVR
ncbi:MAG: type II secretion system protein GspM [Bacillota bacterium]